MYRLIGRLEASELSDLFRAESSGRSVVVKLFHPRTTDDTYAKVIAEVSRSLRRASHSGIAQVLEIGLIDGRLAVVREDPGRSSLGQALQRLTAREAYLPPALALALTIELLDVLGTAHAAGVVHGALTPGNVLLTADGHVAIADFGALRALQASKPLSAAFGATGRSAYRAPELKSAESAEPSSDLYAVGAMIYELLTLKEAVAGDVSTRSVKLPPPSRLVRRLNARIDAVVMRALEPAPARRFKSAAELAQGLREFLLSTGGVPDSGGLAKFVDELFPKDLVMDALGPVPFTEPFELRDVESIGPLPPAAPTRASPVPRSPFSGGEVTDRVETVDGQPVFLSETTAPKTEPSVPQVQEWDAPPGVPDAPIERPAAPEGPNKRFKVVEDFSDQTPVQGPTPPAEDEALKKQHAKTIMTFVTPFQRTDVPQVPGYRELRAKAQRRARLTAMVGAVIVALAAIAVGATWFSRTPDPAGTAFSYLPLPIQRAFAKEGGPPPPPPPNQRLKLPEFDKLHPEKAFHPEGPTEPVKQADSDCYQPPKAPVAFISVQSKRPVRVDIDGVKVCGSLAKLAVVPGKHRVRIVDSKTEQEYVSVTTFEAGKLFKLVPTFNSK